VLPFLRINRAKLSSFTRTSSIFFGVDTKGGPKGDGFSKWGPQNDVVGTWESV